MNNSNRVIIFKSNQTIYSSTRKIFLSYQALGSQRICHFKKILYMFNLKIKSE